MSRSEAILKGGDGPEVLEEAALGTAPLPVSVNGVVLAYHDVQLAAAMCEHRCVTGSSLLHSGLCSRSINHRNAAQAQLGLLSLMSAHAQLACRRPVRVLQAACRRQGAWPG
eukprot:9943096-Alexandrium_andersonii.AAC.1